MGAGAGETCGCRVEHGTRAYGAEVFPLTVFVPVPLG
jgi:hypothetical protein